VLKAGDIIALTQEEYILLELSSEIGELLLQACDLLVQQGDFCLETPDALAVGGDRGCTRLDLWLWLESFYIAGQEMGVAGLLGTGLPGKNFDKRGLALHQMLQAGLHGAQAVERMHAFGAAAKFAWGLGTAQQQDAEDGDLVTIEVEGFLEAVFVLGHAAVRGADGTDQGFSIERMQGLANDSFVEIHRRIAIRFLIAGVDECVERKRIVFGSGDLFFDEGAQHPAFGFV
jgi:hypothetical protein